MKFQRAAIVFCVLKNPPEEGKCRQMLMRIVNAVTKTFIWTTRETLIRFRQIGDNVFPKRAHFILNLYAWYKKYYIALVVTILVETIYLQISFCPFSLIN